MAFRLELTTVMSEDDNASEASTVSPVPHRSPAVELHATYTSLEVLVALVAVVGNAMVIYVFHRDRRLRRRTNYYIVSLAVADFLVGLLGIPFAILASVGLPRNLHACLFTVSLLVMLCTISIFCLVAVSVDRYWAILHPMCYSRNVRTKTAIVRHGLGARAAPARLRRPRARERRRRARQSRAGARPHCTMRLHALFVYIFVNILFVRAKIHGGPRGRFDQPLPTKPAYNHHVSAHHTHYSYHPPTHIKFICRHCTSVTSYPVFHGLPPTYVYKYRESGNRYGDLLTGLALYNLGRVNSHWHDAHYYAPRPDEKCSLQVIDRAHFEETIFPCFMMSSFMKEKAAVGDGPDSFDITSAQVNVKPFIQTTGSPVEVTREQMCVVWRNATAGKERTAIPCALLKEYSNTMKPSGVPVYVWLPITLATVVAISVCCQCLCRKREVSKEEAPINNTIVGHSYQ